VTILIITVALITSLILWFFRQQGLRYYRSLYLQQREKSWLFDIMEHNLNEI
jgi:hypothetical protein